MAAQVWDGGAITGNWADANNWNPNGTPPSSANLTFNAANANGEYVVTLQSTDRTAGSMTFAKAGGANGFTFNTGTGALTISGGITNNDTATQIFNVPIAVSSSQTWNAASGGLTFNGAVSLGSDLTLAGAANIAINGTLDLGGTTRTITVNNTATTTVAGTITEPWYSNLVKSGSGTLVLSGTNAYTGTTTVNAGTLVLANNNALGASGTWGQTLASGATLALQGGIMVNEGGFNISGTGVGGGGAIRNLSGDNTLGGQIQLGSAATIASDSGTLTLTGQMNPNSPLTFSGAGNITAGGEIDGTNLIKSGTGTVTLSGASANSFSNLAVNDGTVVFAKTAGTNAMGGGTLTIGDGSGGASSAALQLGANDQIPDYASVIVNSDGKLALNDKVESINTVAGTGKIDFGNSGTLTVGVNSGNSTFAGTVTGAGTLIKSGSGTFTLSGANTYTGGTNISAGTFAIGANNALAGTNTAVTIASGAILNVNGYTDAVGSITGPGNITLGSGALSTGANNTSTIFSGIISGAGSLAKSGSGALTLTGANTYTGGTKVNAGTLVLNANNALASTGAVAIAAGAMLTLNNYTQTIGAVSGSGTLQLNTGGTLTLGRAMNLSGGSTLVLAGGTLNLNGTNSTVDTLSVTASSIIDFTGTSVLNVLNKVTVAYGATLTITDWVNGVDYFYSVNNPMPTLGGTITFTGYSPSATNWQSFDHQITPVPEPSAYGAVFMFLGLCGVAWSRLRSSRSARAPKTF
jgi:autotransporter-associated beta strand protein